MCGCVEGLFEQEVLVTVRWSLLSVVCPCAFLVGDWLSGGGGLLFPVGCLAVVASVFLMAVWQRWAPCSQWLSGRGGLLVPNGCLAAVTSLFPMAVWRRWPPCPQWLSGRGGLRVTIGWLAEVVSLFTTSV